MAHSRPDGSANEADLQVVSGMETDLLQIEERPRRELVSGQFGEQDFPLHLTKQSENSRELPGTGSGQTECVHRISVIAHHERRALCRRQPKALFSEC